MGAMQANRHSRRHCDEIWNLTGSMKQYYRGHEADRVLFTFHCRVSVKRRHPRPEGGVEPGADFTYLGSATDKSRQGPADINFPSSIVEEFPLLLQCSWPLDCAHGCRSLIAYGWVP
jgi:hypothetical protein